MAIAAASRSSWWSSTANRHSALEPSRNGATTLESRTLFTHHESHMIELNPVRQRIADLTGRLHSLRGYL